MRTLRVPLSHTTLRSLVFLTLGFAVTGHAATVSRDGLTFDVDLPPGLQDVSQLAQFNKELVALMMRTENGQGIVRLFAISDLRGVIGRGHLTKEHVIAPGASLELVPWRSFDVDVLRIPETAADIDYVTFNAQIPLKPRAIQVRVSGPASDEAELRLLLTRTLASLDGPTNWLTIEQRAGSFTRGVISLAIISALVFYLVRRIRRHRKATRATDGGSTAS